MLDKEKKETRIRRAVEDKLWEVLKGKKTWDGQKVPIDKDELLAVSLGIKYLAVSAKLSEQEFGKDLGDLNKAGDDQDPEKEIGDSLDESDDDDS